MNWPNEVVEKVERAQYQAAIDTYQIGLIYKMQAQAALSAITLQDVAKLPEVKALVEGARMVSKQELGVHVLGDTDPYYTSWDDGEYAIKVALTPFTEASNESAVL